jgi:hypothetical protein
MKVSEANGHSFKLKPPTLGMAKGQSSSLCKENECLGRGALPKLFCNSY